ncbi:MAG: signal recognition particle protein [Proteobacteria bacterium]|nr:signal recognition particle protein [Pseudomonadota bacterium]NIS68227.1 signal recognition particle protein [Pseudomonadota bacterium]
MFESLTDKLSLVFKKLRGHGKLTEQNIQEALREVRMALLEADVHFRVVKDFIESVRGRAVGEEVMASLTPAQQVVKIVHQELVTLMGSENRQIRLSGNPPVPLMFVGLHGCGKTTTVAKLARLLKGNGRVPYMVSADVYRPAAVEQLHTLASQIEVDFYEPHQGEEPLEICKKAQDNAVRRGCDTLLIDTAGRLHFDEILMDELREIKRVIPPKEILLVADAMTGQDAVNIAKSFNDQLGIDGVILTKMDGDARGGAALSIRAVTGSPIKFIGVGEKIEAIEAFHPDRMAARILGMGDVLSLIERAQTAFDEKKAKELERKIRKAEFTLEDFKDQLRQIRKMGSLEGLLQMIPGLGKVKGMGSFHMAEKELVKVEAIINSMTPQERRNHNIINGKRRLRIARGSGTTVQDVNRLLRQYLMTRKMLSKMKTGRLTGVPRGVFPFS